MLYIDRFRVEQIIRNLVSNAIKLTPEEGHITLRFVRNVVADASGVSSRLLPPREGRNIDIVLMDYVIMVHMNGPDEVHADRIRLPWVGSGHHRQRAYTPEDLDYSRSQGADCVITRPLTNSKLMDAIRETYLAWPGQDPVLKIEKCYRCEKSMIKYRRGHLENCRPNRT